MEYNYLYIPIILTISFFKEKIQQTLGKNLYGSKQLMVVDDSPVIRKIVEKLLRMLGFGGFNFIGADNGVIALSLLDEKKWI